MAKTIELIAEARTEFGKGAARRLRKQNVIPAVLYSRGEQPDHVVLPSHATSLALRQANVLLSIKMPDGSKQLALPKQIQRNPIRDTVLHVDLLKVHRGEKVQVSVPIYIVGEPEDSSLLINQDLNELQVTADATNIPASIEISVAGFELGQQVLAGDVQLPEDVELAEDAEVLVVSIAAPISEEQLEAELETPEGEDAQPEVVGKESDGEDSEESDSKKDEA